MEALTMDQGDTRRMVADFTGSAAPFDDLTDAGVSLHLAPKSTGATAATTLVGAADAPGVDGKAHTCRSAPLDALFPGLYLATMEVTKSGEVERQSAMLKVIPTAAT